MCTIIKFKTFFEARKSPMFALRKSFASHRSALALARFCGASYNSPLAITAYQQSSNFSTRSSGRGRKVSRGRKSGDGEDGEGSALSVPPPSPVPLDPADAWTEVRDKNSGMIYWWNTVTNETTALGAPRPTGPSALAQPMPQQQGGMMSGLGRVVAEGFAFGTGSAIAHNVVGNLFGGSSGGGGHDDAGDSGDSWDV